MTFRLSPDLPAELRSVGLEVHELGRDGLPGVDWRGVTARGEFRPIGQACHWDGIGRGIDPVRWATLLQRFPRFNGAPTYNGGIYDDGSVWLWCAGKSVNVGLVDSRVEAAVVGGRDLPKPRRGDHYGNGSWLGWVIRNDGSEQIPVRQLEALVMVVGVTARLHEFPVERTTVQHHQLTSRKIDIRTGVDVGAAARLWLDQIARVVEGDERMDKIPVWELRRRAQHALELMYRRYWGPTAVPDPNGWRYWCGLLWTAAEEGIEAVGRVLAAAEEGFRRDAA